jgi:ankyrin repeat protein
VSALLAGGANLEDATHPGRTPLILAAGKGHTALVRLLLARGANVDARSETGHTAYDHAEVSGYPGIMELLAAAR